MKTETKFVVCIENKNYSASLEFGKIYRVIEDEKAAAHKMLRVIDESGEDYLYSENSLLQLNLPQFANPNHGLFIQALNSVLYCRQLYYEKKQITI